MRAAALTAFGLGDPDQRQEQPICFGEIRRSRSCGIATNVYTIHCLEHNTSPLGRPSAPQKNQVAESTLGAVQPPVATAADG